MAKKADNKHINKQQINLSNAVSHIDSNNLSLINKGFTKSSFGNFLESFVDTKSDSINRISCSMSENNIKMNTLGGLMVNSKNIENYDQRDSLNYETQHTISHIFLNKLWNKGKSNLKFKEVFEYLFKNFEEKKISFHDIQSSLDELTRNFPDIIDNISVSNEDIFQGLNNKYGSNINMLNDFNSQDISDKNTLCELIYWETKESAKKINNIKNKIDTDANNLVAPLLSPKGSIDDFLIEMDDKNLEWKKENGNKINPNLKTLRGSNEKNNNKKNEPEDKPEKTDTNVEIDEINEQIQDVDKNTRREHIKYFEGLDCTDEKNKNFLNILSKLVDNNFDYSRLSNDEQKLYMDKTIEKNIEALADNEWMNGFGLDENKYRDFLRKIMSFDKKNEDITISLPNGDDINLKIKKSFRQGENLDLLNYENFKNTAELPIIFDIELDGCDKDVIEMLEDKNNAILSNSINSEGIISEYKAKNGIIRVGNNYNLNIDGVDVDAKTLNKIAMSNDEEELKAGFKEHGLWDEKISKIFEKELIKVNEKIKNNKTKKHEKINEIFEGVCENLDIKVKSRNLELKGSSINKINQLYIFAIAQSDQYKNIENIEKGQHSAQDSAYDFFNKLSDSAIDSDDNEKKKNDKKENSDLKSELDYLIKGDNNVNSGEPSREEVLANADLNNEDRIKKAEALLREIAKTNNLNLKGFDEKIKNGLLDLVLFAHESTIINKDEYDILSAAEQNNYIQAGDKYYEFGKDGIRPAGVYNNTKTQLKEKIKILQSAVGFEGRQIRALLVYGICGINPDNISQQSGKTSADKIFEQIKDAENYNEDTQQEVLETTQYDAQKEFDRLDSVGKKAFKEKLEESALYQDSEEVKNNSKNIIENLEDKNIINNENLSKEEIKKIEEEERQQELEDRKRAEANEDTPEQKFTKSRDKLSGNNKCECEKGTRLMINIGGSKLPPKDQSDSFFELEIININDTKFQIKIIGNEFKSDMNGQTMWFPKTDEQLSLMKGSGEIFKIAKGDPKNWDKCIDNLNASKITNKTTIFGSGDGEVKMENGKFINDKGEEISHFCRSEDEYSGELDAEGKKAKGQTKNYTNYKIKKINKSKGTVHVLCNFDGQDPNNLSKRVNYKYDRELSYEQFILLMESKKTRGYTEEQKNEVFGVNGPDRLPNKGILTFYSLGAIWGAVKNGAKKIKEKVTGVNEDEVADFENLLYSEEGLDLYGKLGGMVGALKIFPGIEDAFGTAKMEYYGERETRTWKKIDKRYKLFEADAHFPTLRYGHLAPLLETPGFIGNDKNRHKIAAAFLILMKKDGPYGRGKLLQHMGKGYWIEKFLGKTHKDRFNTMFQQRKKQLEENIDGNPHQRKRWQEELNRLEFDYMTGVIDGRQPFGGFDKDGEHGRASMWSRNFATTLDENQKTYFSGFDDKAKNHANISFRQAEQEYFRMVTVGRFHKALPFLKRMAEDAQDKSAENRVKMCITGAMLAGLFKNTQNSGVMTEFWAISRTMGFLPGIWARDTNQQDKMLKLLDGITSEPPFKKFSADVKDGGTGYKKADFEPGNWNEEQKNLKFLSQTLPQYWETHEDDLLDILEFRNMDSKSNNIINLAEKGGDTGEVCQEILEFSREKTSEDTSQEVSYVYGYNIHSPWTTNKSMVENKVPRDGKYPGKEKIEVEAAEEFWTSVSRSFDTGRQSKAGNVEFYLGKYRNWFDNSLDQTNTKIMMRGLPLVKKLKDAGNEKEARYQLRYLTKGMLHSKLGGMPSEFSTAIDKFEEFFWNNMDYFDTNMVKNIFGDEAADDFDNPYGMLGWGEFNSKFMLFDGQTGGGADKTKYIKEYKQGKYREEDYINWEISALKKRVKGKGTVPTPPSSDIFVYYGNI